MTNRFGRVRAAAMAVAAIVLLALISTCVDQPTAPPQPIESANPTLAVGEEPAILAGAGNIARCDGANDEKTALQLDAIPGTVFTTGDNVHASGALSDYETCYGSSTTGWGRHRARTRPAPGDDDYKVAGASGSSATSAPPPATPARATTATTSAAGTSSS